MMRSQEVLITGGAGFIGSHLADELLSRGYHVRALDNLAAQVHGDRAMRPSYLDPDVELIVGDVRDPRAVREALDGVDAGFHFAAAVGVGQSMYEVEHYTAVNNAFNMGGGAENTTSLLELLDMIRDLRGDNVKVSFDDWRVGDQRYYVSDTRKFQHATGWKPQVNVADGVARLYEWLAQSRALRTPAERAAIARPRVAPAPCAVERVADELSTAQVA